MYLSMYSTLINFIRAKYLSYSTFMSLSLFATSSARKFLVSRNLALHKGHTCILFLQNRQMWWPVEHCKMEH